MSSFIEQVPNTLGAVMVQPVAFPMFLLRGLHKRTKPNQSNQPMPSIHNREVWEVLEREMLAVTLCIPTCLRVFQLTREFFTKELKKHYVRNNDTDVFSSTWNSVMITVSQAMLVPRYWWSAAIHAVLSQHLLAPPGSGGREVTVHWQPGFPTTNCSCCWE